jgi:hypothetical protein
MPPYPEKLPFDAKAIAETHSALTAVLAGFALAGLFLLIERVQEAQDDDIRQRYLRAMLLLFVAFVTGTMSAYLYSSNVGDTPLRSYLIFHFPSAIFAIHGLVLLVGINMVFSVFAVKRIMSLARHISYCVVLFSVGTIFYDLWTACEVFGFPGFVRMILFFAGVAPLAISFLIVTFKINVVRKWFREKTFSAFCYTTVSFSMLLAFAQTYHNYTPDEAIQPQYGLLVFLMTCVSTLGAWNTLILPKL